MDTVEAAEAIGTTARKLRLFLRSPSSPFETVGSGSRYDFEVSDLEVIRERFSHWEKFERKQRKRTKHAKGHRYCDHENSPKANGACNRRQRDEAVWAEDGPVELEDIRNPRVREKVRRVAKEQEALLNVRLLAAGLHVSQQVC